MFIDIYTHIFPGGYFARMAEAAPRLENIGKRMQSVTMIHDLDARFRLMDEFGDYGQVITLPNPPLEDITEPAVGAGLARVANDAMAELVQKHPDRFPAFVATLAMHDMDAAMDELHRAIRDLGARGVQIFTNIAGEPLDLPKFQPLFDAMAEYDLPIWMHPARAADMSDYKSEQRSRYEMWWCFGWPYETSVAMARLVFAGLFDKHPGLKIITHHLGAMVPYFEGRVGPGWDQLGSRTSDQDYGALLDQLEKRPLDYFKMFYADSAVFGSASATRCGLDFFGADKVLFASDSPFDPEKGPGYIRETIAVLDGLGLSPAELEQIYRGNAVKLLKLEGD